MLDQRGTGRSTPVGALPGRTPEEQAEYLTHFRADSIVRDAEWIRRELGVDRWSVLGQSFGGFCVLTYLSLAPEGLREAFFTGGLPPIGRHVDDVYRATYERVLDRNRRYYDRYPADRERVREIRRRLDAEDVRLPGGDRLTGRRFRQIGHMLGMGSGAEHLHYILELPPDSPAFLHDVDAAGQFPRNPLYAAIHEACYADGCATRWSAERLLPRGVRRPRALHRRARLPVDVRGLLGARAAPRGGRDPGRTWSGRASTTPSSCGRNEVPAAAAVYAEDMYVERAFSEETAARVRGLRPWVTNEYQHDGLRAEGDRILGRLIDLARGRA